MDGTAQMICGDTMPSLRAFIAVEVAEAVRRRAAELALLLAAAPPRVRWVDPANMHLTLKFLGDVPEAELPAVCQALAAAAADFQAFDLHFRGAGAFPSVSRPATLWIGVASGHDVLARLHEAIERRMRAIGFPKEGRRFAAHLTLGRVRGGPGLGELARLVRDHADDDFGTSRVAAVAAFSSRLLPTGPVYDRLTHCTLIGAEAAGHGAPPQTGQNG